VRVGGDFRPGRSPAWPLSSQAFLRAPSMANRPVVAEKKRKGPVRRAQVWIGDRTAAGFSLNQGADRGAGRRAQPCWSPLQ